MNKLEKGHVIIKAGFHRGEVGFYAKDVGKNKALVYLDEPNQGRYEIFSRYILKNLKNYNVSKWISKNPEKALAMGVSA